MREMPECLSRRYRAVDELIAELTSAMSKRSSNQEHIIDSTDEAGVKLMCEFWNILKEDPECDLSQAVRQRMGLNTKSSRSFRPQKLTCYMASNHGCSQDNKNVCSSADERKGVCCNSKSLSPKSTNETISLSKVLCNLKEAVSFDKKCNIRINELMGTQAELQGQIQVLEEREKEGTELLKEADCMWSCMEDAYKKKVSEATERQNTLLKQMKEIDASNTKWRKNKKDLEFQLTNANKCYQEIKEKIQEKTNDNKCIKMEIDDFKKRLDSNKKETAAIKKSFDNKKKSSNAKIMGLSSDISRIKNLVQKEEKYKQEKEQEGSKYVKEARDDLQNISRVLLQKRLENEDLRAEKEALLQEIDLLRKSCDQCKERCQNKQKAVVDEITKIDDEIAVFKVRCIKCHECTETVDIRKFCTDCPRCAEERDCLYEDDHCCPDVAMDCVCMSTKHKFMENVFDNMYTVLERQVKTSPGKAVADAVLNCLKKSRNGKLNDETKKILQEFVLSTVKKNLNLTIIGGAVKTRCEMDPETYQQLMLCLKQVKTAQAPKKDKGTVPKKDPCRRWGGTSECNCPKGPKSCICTKKAPPLPNEPNECAPPTEKEDAGEVTMCPHKESAACGVDCAMHAVPSAVGTDVAAWRPAPCDEKHCTFTKSMRAAQCVLGPDSLASPKAKGYTEESNVPHVPNVAVLESQIICKCGSTPTKPCVCRTDTKHLKEGIEQCDSNICALACKEPKEVKLCQGQTEYYLIEDSDDSTKVLDINLNISNSNSYKEIHSLEKGIAVGNPQLELTTNIKNDKGSIKINEKDDILHDINLTVSIKGENNQLHTQFTKLNSTSSGALTMELDENIVKELEQKIYENPNISICLRKTLSGHCLIDFSPINDILNNLITVKKSLSGALIFEVDKNIIDALEDNTKQGNTCDSKSSISITIKSKHNDVDSTGNFQKQETDGLDDFKVPKHICMTNSIKNTTPSNSVKNENTFANNIDTPLLSAQENIDSYNNTRYNILKLNFNDPKRNIVYPPAILRSTNSDNCIVIIDKEYETRFKALIKEQISADYECPVEVSQTNSGSYVILFEDSEDNNRTSNALLIRSLSGNIKIIFDNVNNKRVSVQSNTKSTTSRGKESPKIFSDMLTRLPTEKKGEKNDKTNNVANKKSISDSNLYDNNKFQYKNKNLRTELSASLKKTSSGQYTIVLDKESKRTFINNLKNYLASSSHGFIPIKRSESGEIEILLNKDADSKHKCESLKITPSGNIFVLVDENYINDVSIGLVNEKPASVNDIVKSQTNTSKNQPNTKNKSVTTTCNALPDSSCDASKCVCGDLLNNFVDNIKTKYNDYKSVTKLTFCPVGENEFDCRKCPYSSPSKFKEDNNLPKQNVPRDKSPHIVIKPSSCRSQKHLKLDDQQLYYVTESICPFHKNRYNAVSNELLEISGLCSKGDNKKLVCRESLNPHKIDKVHFERFNTGYLDYLPPQLPAFLKNF